MEMRSHTYSLDSISLRFCSVFQLSLYGTHGMFFGTWKSFSFFAFALCGYGRPMEDARKSFHWCA